MTQPKVGPTSPRARSAALYSDMVRRPPAPVVVPTQPRGLPPLTAAALGRPTRQALVLPGTLGPVRPAGSAAFRTAHQLLLMLAQQLNLKHMSMMRASTLAQLTFEDKGYCDKLLNLNNAFRDILSSTRNFTINLEHLHEDMARLLEAHLQHGRALLRHPALVMTNNLSYKSFDAPAGERPAPVLLKVPLDELRVTWLPTGHKLLHEIAVRCPLPAIKGQVASFYRIMADLAEARQHSSEHETNRRMFGEVVSDWRDYSANIERRC